LPISNCALPIISQGSDVRWQCDKLITASPPAKQLAIGNEQWAMGASLRCRTQADRQIG
jgi:hypothetical protein